MKVPSKISTYCPKCMKHTEHSVKVIFKKSPAKARTLAWGSRKQNRKIAGYTSQLAGKAWVVKQSKRSVLMLQCPECKKKHEISFDRMKKAIDIKKGE
ncbi:MAG: 50S ribosomal protein L44e [archaeon]